MADVIKMWLSLSLSGSILILALWFGRTWYQERFSRRWQYYIWLLVIARLWILAAPEQNLVGSLFHGMDRAGGWLEEMAEDYNDMLYDDSQEAEWTELPQNTGQGETSFPSGEVTETKSPKPVVLLAGLADGVSRAVKTAAVSLSVVWLAGALLLLLYKMMIYRRFTKNVRAGWSEPDDIQVLERFGRVMERSKVRGVVRLYTNPHVASPLLIGFVHPCIVLPTADMPETDFTYTILHELTHLKRLDMFYKWLVQITLCLHWFNPLVHLMAREISRTCELSCDEAVIRSLDEAERRSYGDTLLHAVSMGGGYKNNLASVTLYEGRELLKERLGVIMNYKKRSKLLMAVTFVCTIGLTVAAVTTGAYAAAGTTGSSQWESKGENGRVTHSYRQDGYYETPYIIELGWNLSESAYKAYAGKAEIPLKNGDVVKSAFDDSCASYRQDEPFMTALTSLVERISEKKLNSHFEFRLERPLVISVQNVSGRDLTELANEFYRDGKLTSFNAIFPEISMEAKDKLCEKIYEDSSVSFFSCAQSSLDAALLNKYAERSYQDNKISFFSQVAWNLSEAETNAYAKKAFEDEKITFFSELLPYVAKEEIKNYAEHAYQNNQIAMFSIVMGYLSEEDSKAFQDRAKRDNKITFYTVLADE